MKFDKNKYKSKKKWKDSLTDNVRANELLSPVYFIFTYFLIKGSLSFDFIVLQYTFLSTLIYIYASNYFQPDLDVDHSRPGMGHFPLGRWVNAYWSGRFFKIVFKPINRLWYWMWHPYGKLLTHRGIGHWPILGVWLRVSYLFLWIIFFQGFLELFGINFELLNIFLNGAGYWVKAFFPWSQNFGSNYWFLFCFPVYLSDIIHIFVDYIDSAKRGLAFCPKKIPRGKIYKFFKKS